MKIIIHEIRLQNWKCFRDKTFFFSEDVTNIGGCNGSGKTTIADAILWCLFGKNTLGQSQFELKTKGEDGEPIPRLDHSVEMFISVDGAEHTLKRTVKETWVKKHGADELVFKNNTTEYLIDGDTRTATEFKRYVGELVEEDIFKAITNPTYFPSLKWEKQREFLQKIADDADDHEQPTDEVLRANLERQSIEAYIKSLITRIKAIREKLDKIPTRLEEQNKALPEKLDWVNIHEKLHDVIAQIDATEREIRTVKMGNSVEVRRSELKEQLRDVRWRMNEIDNDVRKSVTERQAERDMVIRNLNTKFFETSTLLNKTKQDIEMRLSAMKRCEQSLADYEKEKLVIRSQWNENQERTLPFTESDRVCPTCGQMLPEEMMNEKVAEMRRVFNESKAETKKRLTERANALKRDIAAANDSISEYKALNEKAEAKVKELNELLIELQGQINEQRQSPVPVFADVIKTNVEYTELAAKEQSLLTDIENVGVGSDKDKELLASLEQKKSELMKCREDLIRQEATKEQYDRIQKLIEDIEAEKKDLVSQLSEKEREEDAARDWQTRQIELLEQRVNEKFEFVKWKLFRTVNNGGDPFTEPFCECYVDNVAYHDGLNAAARLNAGIAIIKTLCKHYDVYAPIVLDNAEGVNDVLPTDSQQIRLYVTTGDLEVL